MKSLSVMFIGIALSLTVGCQSKVAQYPADTIPLFLDSCIAQLEGSVPPEKYMEFCMLPENYRKFKAKEMKFKKAIEYISSNKQKSVDELNLLKAAKPYEEKMNQYARYSLPGNRGINLVFNNGRWYFEK